MAIWSLLSLTNQSQVEKISNLTIWSLLSLKKRSQLEKISALAIWSLLSPKNQSHLENISAGSIWSLLSLKKRSQPEKKILLWPFGHKPQVECCHFFYLDECGVWCRGYGHVTLFLSTPFFLSHKS